MHSEEKNWLPKPPVIVVMSIFEMATLPLIVLMYLISIFLYAFILFFICLCARFFCHYISLGLPVERFCSFVWIMMAISSALNICQTLWKRNIIMVISLVLSIIMFFFASFSYFIKIDVMYYLNLLYHLLNLNQDLVLTDMMSSESLNFFKPLVCYL